MSTQFSVPLDKLVKVMNLTVHFMPQADSPILVTANEINRPGLQLSGFFEYFDPERIQIFGKSEFAFLEGFSQDQRQEITRRYFATKPRAIVFTRSHEPTDCMMDMAREYDVPLLSSQESTSTFMAALIAELNVELAPRVTRHGVLVEVYGEGVFLTGDSGVGKSEAAIELIKRGHRLIADDAVEIRRVSSKTLVGCSPENIRHFMELRGVGIINAMRLFGIGAVKVTEKINMIVELEQWDSTKVYDRMGMEEHYTHVLDVPVPSLTIPIKPGRNLAIIIEVASMNNRQKRMGYNAASDLLEKLGMPPMDAPMDWGGF